MIVLKQAGLVFLSNPKTAGRSIRNMLAAHAAEIQFDEAGRHVSAETYAEVWQSQVVARLGFQPISVSVMREPRSHMESWYRYRQRRAVRGHPNSTEGIPFDAFVTARMSVPTPAYARIGRQDRFLGLVQGRPQVDYIFDYARLDLLLAFLSGRLGVELALPRLNVSPSVPPENLSLPAALEARYRATYVEEFALYERVTATGFLATGD